MNQSVAGRIGGGDEGGTPEVGNVATTGGEGAEWRRDWTWTEHAMTNHVIMRTLFGMLPSSDLFKWRKVCKPWNAASCLVLNVRDRVLDGYPIKINSSNRLAEFLNLLHDRFGFHKLKFRSFNLSVSKLSEAEIQTFLESTGKEIRDLELLYDLPHLITNLDRRDRILPSLVEILREVKHLTNLSLSSNVLLGSENEWREYNLPAWFPFLKCFEIDDLCDLGLRETLVSYIVERSPKLEFIALLQCTANAVMNLGLVRGEIPSLLENAAKKDPSPQIILGPHREHHRIDSLDTLVELIRQGPNLVEIDMVKELYLHYNGSMEENFVTWLNELLVYQAEILVSLTVTATLGNLATPLSLERMERLKDLTLFYWECTAISPIQPFVPRQFPVLQVLILNEYRAEWSWFPEDLVIPTLKFLALGSYVGDADEETWDVSFPNLRLLRIAELERSIPFLKFVLTKMTMIRVLMLLNRNRDTAQDTTPRDNIGNDLWTLYTGGEGNEGAGIEVGVGVEQPRPSLANLKDLVSFDLVILTTMELEAVVLMSKAGQLPPVNLTIIDRRQIRQTRSGTRKTAEMLRTLRNYHEGVTFTS